MHHRQINTERLAQSLKLDRPEPGIQQFIPDTTEGSNDNNIAGDTSTILQDILQGIISSQSPIQLMDAINAGNSAIGNRSFLQFIDKLLWENRQRQTEKKSIAAKGLRGPGRPMTHLDTIQQAFGHHDISGMREYTGRESRKALDVLGAEGYSSNGRMALRGAPDLYSQAHEAAHGVQQAALEGSMQLKRGIGEAGDKYERNADAVADAVVRGESAETLLDRVTGGPTEVNAAATTGNAPVQMMRGGLFRGAQRAVNQGARFRLSAQLFQAVRRALSQLPDFVFSRDSFPDYYRILAGVPAAAPEEEVAPYSESWRIDPHKQTFEHALIEEMTDSFKGKAISWRELEGLRGKRLTSAEIAAITSNAFWPWPNRVRGITNSIVSSNADGDPRKVRFNMSHLDMSIFHNLPLFTSPREEFDLNNRDEWMEFHRRFGFTFWELFWVLTNPDVMQYTEFYYRHSAEPWLKKDWGNIYEHSLDNKIQYRPLTEEQKTEMGIVPFEYSDRLMRWVNPLDIDCSRNMPLIAQRFNSYPHEWNYPLSAVGTAKGLPRLEWEPWKKR